MFVSERMMASTWLTSTAAVLLNGYSLLIILISYLLTCITVVIRPHHTYNINSLFLRVEFYVQFVCLSIYPLAMAVNSSKMADSI